MSAAASSPPTSPSGKTTKTSNSRRKISLPWFRQASIGEKLHRFRLPRQNTVGCPPSGSGKYNDRVGGKEITGSASLEVCALSVRVSPPDLATEVNWVSNPPYFYQLNSN